MTEINSPETTSQEVSDSELIGAALTLTFVLVLIERDSSTKIPAEVPEYELDIIERIYGEDMIEVVERNERSVESFDAETALNALRNKYEKFEGIVDAVFPSARAFARATGAELGERSDVRREPQSLVVDHSKKAGTTTKATTAKKATKTAARK